GIFIKELSVLYNAFSLNQPSPLSEPPFQYADFTIWQRQWLQGEIYEAELNYWKQTLGNDLPTLELPTDYPRGAIQTYRWASQTEILPTELYRNLKMLVRREGATLYMVLLAAFDALLYRYSDQHDIVVGTSVANRNYAGVENLMGFFVNTLVMRTDLSG